MASRFISIEIIKKNTDRQNQYFSSVVISNIIISLVLLVPCCCIVLFLEYLVSVPTNILTDVKVLWGFLFANFLFTIIVNVYSVATFATNRLYLSSLRTMEGHVIRAALIVALFALFTPSIWYMGFAVMIYSMYTAIFNVYYTRKYLPDMHCRRKFFNIKCVKELLSAGIWNSFTQLASVLNNGVDLLISNLFISPAAMGVMSIAKTIPNHFAEILPMFSTSVQPELVKNYAENNKKALLDNIDFARKLSTLISALVVGVVMVNGDKFFKLWVPGENAAQLQLIASVSMLIYIFVGSLTPVSDALLIVNKLKYVAVTYFLAGVLNICAVYAILKMTSAGIIAPTWIDIETFKLLVVAGTSGFIAIIRNIIFTPIYASKCFSIKWYVFYPTLIKGILSTVAVIVLAYVIRNIINMDSWLMFIAGTAIVVVIGTIACFVIMFNKAQKKQLLFKIRSVIKNKLN